MKVIILLFFIYLSTNIHATLVTQTDYNQGWIKLVIHKIEVDSFDTIKMTNFNYRDIQLVCAGNKFYLNKKAIIQFKNYYNIHIADFVIDDDKKCRDLREFLTATFEAIDYNNPLIIKLDIKSKTVAEIIYPNIDPYTQEIISSEEDIIVNQFN